MCEFCDERGLPCLLCGAGFMRYQFDRERCGGCAHVNRPPRQWPVFAFCPYCGRDLSESNDFKEKYKGEHGDMENKYRWTDEADEIVRTMLREGAYKEDICDKLGITDKQLSNRLCVLRSRGEELPRLKSSGRIPCEGNCTGACETCEKLDEMQIRNTMLADRISRLEAAIERKNRTIAALSEELYGEED